MRVTEAKKNRLENFEYLMHVLDEAEGVRDTKQGSFSFLDEGYYVRQVVVSPRIRTSIAGLKTFLVTEVLEIFEAKSKYLSLKVGTLRTGKVAFFARSCHKITPL